MTEASLFAAALEKTNPDDRAAFLNEACAGDDRLRRRVEALLRAHAEPDDVLDAPPPRCATADYQPIAEKAGSRIGFYKLMEQIGEGGFGLVFVAEQQEPVRRKVALKVIKPGMDSRQVVARFQAERQALAMMDHPNIARVFDAGETASGRPYFVMELVRGIPITEYCDKNQLTPRERLELFITVCQAVQHAHQKGVIHRDLKPSNVLVASHDGKPVAKVIDFGVAKAIHQHLTDGTIYTQLAQMIGTPLYMSPEQAEMSGLDIDTRSDIYSLGVLLYELLTGTTPIDRLRFRQAAYEEIRRMIREDEPAKPSTRLSELGRSRLPDGTSAAAGSARQAEPTSSLASIAAQRKTEPARLSRLMRGDLDWITMKCLEKDRTRRYDTATGLARDVERYLRDEPVEAGPPSAAYRVRKLLRRNKGPVLAAAIVLLALLGGIVGTTWGMVRADGQRRIAEQARLDEAEQRQIAEAEKKKAEQAEAATLADYRASTDDAIEQLIGSKTELGPKERTYLENTLKRWQAFAARQGDDERSRSIRAEGHFRVALLWQNLGRKEEARAEYQTGRETWKKMVMQFPGVPWYQRQLACTHLNLGILLTNLGKHEEALTEYQLARDIQNKLVEKYPAVTAYWMDLAATHINLGGLLVDLGKREEARAVYQAARGASSKLVEWFPALPEYQHLLATTHNNLGVVLADLGKREEARAEYLAARDLLKKLVERFPDVPGYQHGLARSHNYMAVLVVDLGKREEARAEYLAARDILKKLVGQFPAVPMYQIDLGGSYRSHAFLIRDEGKPAESLEWFELAIRTLKPVHDQEPRDVTAKLYLRNSHWGRAVSYDRLQKFAEAVKDWDRAIELSPPAEQPGFRASRAISQFQAGLVAEAVAEVAELAKNSNWNANQWYDFACVYAVASKTGGINPPARLEYADRAMELLQKAAKAGYKDAAHLKQDKDLDALREREDFKKLVGELEGK